MAPLTVDIASRSANRWIRSTTTLSVVMLALIAGVVSFGHMHELALSAGEGPLTAALIPFSVDGMIVASSMSLLVDSRAGRRGGVLPWALLVFGSAASLAANVAAATPTFEGRAIAAWPSFALIGAYELLMRQVRHSVGNGADQRDDPVDATSPASGAAASAASQAVVATRPPRETAGKPNSRTEAEQGQRQARISRSRGRMRLESGRLVAAADLQNRACAWTLEKRSSDGTLPTGRAIAQRFGRSDRWGRLIKHAATEELLSGSPSPPVCT